MGYRFIMSRDSEDNEAFEMWVYKRIVHISVLDMIIKSDSWKRTKLTYGR